MYTLMLGQTWPQEVMVSKFSIFRGFNYVVQFWWMNLGILNFLDRKNFLIKIYNPFLPYMYTLIVTLYKMWIHNHTRLSLFLRMTFYVIYFDITCHVPPFTIIVFKLKETGNSIKESASKQMADIWPTSR